MAMDSSEYNGSREPTKVELECGEVGSDKDLTKSDSTASPERQENDAEGIGGPFVFVNGDSDDPSEKDLDLQQKLDLATMGEEKDLSEINAGEKEVVESENACDPAEGGNAGAESGEKVEKESTYTGELSEDTTDNGELGEKVEESTYNGELSENTTDNGELGEKVEQESTDNGELNEKTADNGELGEKVEKERTYDGELSENTTDNGESGEKVEEESTDNGELSEIAANNNGEEKESTDNGELSEIAANNNGEEKESTYNGELSEITANNNGEEKESTDNGELSESRTNNGELGEKVEEESRDNGEVIENISNNNGELREEVEEEVTDNGQVGENTKNDNGELGEGEKKEEIKGELGEKEEVENVVVVEEEKIIVEESVVEESEGIQLSESVVDSEAEKEEEIIPRDNGHHKEEEEEEEEEEGTEITSTEEQKESEIMDSSSNVLEPALEQENPQGEEAPETKNMQEEEEEVEVELETTPVIDETPDLRIENGNEDKPQESQSVKESDETPTPTPLTDELPSPTDEPLESDITQDSSPPLETTDESGEVVEEAVNPPESENESAAPRGIDLSETKKPLLDESVQIGNFTICIGENGPATLHHEVAATTSTTATAEGAEKAQQQQLLTLLPKRVFMIKVPRYSNEEQWARIQEAQAHLDDLTRHRDAIRQLIHNKRAVSKDAWDEVQKAREEERTARAVFNAKRHEISSVQSVINKLNKANSIDDMDDLIDAKEKSLQHETMSLKQEKMLIHEIKELKSKRKQLVDNMGSAAEIDEAFNQRDSVYDKLKVLKTELEVLGKRLGEAEGKTKEALKNYEDTERSLCDSQDAHKAAHDVREEAYFRWRHFKNQLAAKNKHFFSYLDERKQANKYVTPALDLESLHSFCNNQVERVMELWNNDEEFRKQYIESNKISTIRRLRTLDGRALAPDEEPPVLPSTSSSSSPSAYKLRSNTPALPITNQIILEKTSHVEKLKEQFPALPQIKAKVQSPPPPKDAVMVTDRQAAVEERKRAEEDEKERKKREDEMERKNREEEIRSKAKAEAQEKERLREVQKAKAKEAEERKKRKADKAQERAEFKARREAEIRDKKRAKKDKKKGEVDSDDNGGGESAAVETTTSPPPVAVAAAATKRPARPAAVKQIKRVEPVPIALRNRNRKKMRTWIIGIATALAAILTVFLIGNYLNWSDISSLFYV